MVFCGGKILLINKNDKWDLPKGKLEKGESLPVCAIRETSEATGVVQSRLSIVKYIGTTDYIRKYDRVEYRKIVHWYQMSYALGTKTPLVPDKREGISECSWFHVEEITGLFIHKHLQDFVSSLLEHTEEILDFRLSVERYT